MKIAGNHLHRMGGFKILPCTPILSPAKWFFKKAKNIRKNISGSGISKVLIAPKIV